MTFKKTRFILLLGLKMPLAVPMLVDVSGGVLPGAHHVQHDLVNPLSDLPKLSLAPRYFLLSRGNPVSGLEMVRVARLRSR